MKRLPMHEFRSMDEISKVSYAYKIKMGYYQFFGIRKDKRNWKYVDLLNGTQREMYCPSCRRVSKIVIVGFMNARTFWGKVIEHQRCETCLIKLPIIDKKIMRMLGYFDKPKELPKGQMILQ